MALTNHRSFLQTVLAPSGKAPSHQSLVLQSAAGLPARPAPHVPLPYLDGRMSRRRLAKLRDNLSEATAVVNVATGLHAALGTMEATRQEGEKIHAARRLLPLAIEASRLGFLADIARAEADLDAAVGEMEQRRVEREKNAQLIPLQTEQLRFALDQDLANARAAAEEHRAEQKEQHVRRERRQELAEEEYAIRKLELAARRRTAEAILQQAGTVGELRGQAERYKAQTEAHRAQAEAEKMRRSASFGDADGIPEHLRRHLDTELEIKRNRAPAAQLAQEIRNRAAGRSLDNSELELIDLLESAAAGAADSIRRGAASDLEE